MLTVIFGAGASYDSLAEYPAPATRNWWDESRPPLADELFQRRDLFEDAVSNYVQSTGLAGIIPRLRNLRPNVSLEQELDEIANDAATDRRRYVQLNAVRFYIRAAIRASQNKWMTLTREVTNYGALVDQIWHWHLQTGDPVRFVTFNYDTMLDRAIDLALPGTTFNTIESYVSRDDLRLYRPHGSITWSRVTSNRLTELSEKNLRGVINLGDRVEPIDDFAITDAMNLVDERVLMPAIAVPFRQKTDFEFPTKHRERLVTDFAATKYLLVVGWRGTDEPFFKLMGGMPKDVRLQVVTGSGDGCEEVRKNLGNGLSLAPSFYQPHGHGFTRFLTNRGFEELVAAR